MKIFRWVKDFFVEVVFGKITREIRYRKKIKEIRKRDPFIY